MQRVIAALFVATLFAVPLGGCTTNRTFGAGLNDSAADLTLKRYLLADTNYDYSDIDITVFEGRLMLTGSVRSDAARRALAAKAQLVPTVTEVLNEVIVGPRTGIGQGTSDALIDERLGAALLTDNGIFRSNYQIAVSKGVVYLLGVAQGAQELERVTSHAQTVPGVKRVVSHVIFVGDPRRQAPRR